MKKHGPEIRNLYRLPWSVNDSPKGWMEVTDICNIHCKGCYRLNRNGHKPFEKITKEILYLKKWRNSDSITLAGGESILHPNIFELVEFVKKQGLKPHIITNGLALNKKLLVRMKKAGLMSIHFHIDSFQNRPDFKVNSKNSEMALNPLRLKYAKMVHDVGGITCNFGITVSSQNLNDIPEFVKWAIENIRYVNSILFNAYSGMPIGKGYKYFLGDKQVAVKDDCLGYAIYADKMDKYMVSSNEIYHLVKKNYPDYDAYAFIGGSVDHTAIKWLLGNIIINEHGKTFGSYGKRLMEFAQTMYHLRKGTYFIHNRKKKMGRKLFLLSILDKPLYSALRRYLRYVIGNPFRLFYYLDTLKINIIQPPSILPDGRIDMCDGCPDLCVVEDKLVNSCRLDECLTYGGLLHVHPVRME